MAIFARQKRDAASVGNGWRMSKRELALPLPQKKRNTNTNNIMKIAIPTRAGRIDDHFGHCEVFTIVELDDDNNIVGKSNIASPEGCGCKSNIASRFEAEGITLLIGGNMGQGALNKLGAHGVKVIRGCSGAIDDIVADYVAGRLKDSGETCGHHHDGEHTCGGDHHVDVSSYKVIL